MNPDTGRVFMTDGEQVEADTKLAEQEARMAKMFGNIKEVTQGAPEDRKLSPEELDFQKEYHLDTGYMLNPAHQPGKATAKLQAEELRKEATQ